MSPPVLASRSQRGITLVEVMIAILVMTTGILALGRLIPSAVRGSQSDRMLTQANAYSQQKLEDLQTLVWSDPLIQDGRHPASSNEALGSTGQWQRHYDVASMAAPLDNLKKITVTVEWNWAGPHNVTATSYIRR
jgi:type II secretory pathway pseudopilin PulG